MRFSGKQFFHSIFKLRLWGKRKKMDDVMDLYDPLPSAGSLSLEEMIENDIRSTENIADDYECRLNDSSATDLDFENPAGGRLDVFDTGLFGDASHHLPWFNFQISNGGHHPDFDLSNVLVDPSTALPPSETADDDDLSQPPAAAMNDDCPLIMVNPSLVEHDDAVTLVKLNRNPAKENRNSSRRLSIYQQQGGGRLINRSVIVGKDRSGLGGDHPNKFEHHVARNDRSRLHPFLSRSTNAGTESSDESSDEDSIDSSDVDSSPPSSISTAIIKAKTSSSSNRSSKAVVASRQIGGRSPLVFPSSAESAQSASRIFPKPAFSYSCLIAIALKNSETGSLPVSEIYSFMTETFPYFKTAPNGWKNSVRHNLSLNKCFEKIEKGCNASNQKKGCLWGLNPDKVDKMEEEVLKWSRKDPVAIKNSMARPETLELLENGCLRFDVDQGKMDVGQRLELRRMDGVPTAVKTESAVAECFELESSSDSDESLREIKVQDDEMWDVPSDAKMDFESPQLGDAISTAAHFNDRPAGSDVNGSRVSRKVSSANGVYFTKQLHT